MIKKGLPLLWFAIIGLVIYGRTLGFDYTYLDDHTLVLEKMEQLSHASYLKTAFTEDVFFSPSGKGYYYRPVLTVSFMVDAMLGKGKFSFFHLMNVIYHILASYLIFLFLLKIGFERTRSFLFTLLFLVHPMLTQAVAWVPGRNDTLLAVFAVSSLIFWINYLKEHKIYWALLHFSFFFIALLTKENAVMIPILASLAAFLLIKTNPKRLIFPVLIWIPVIILWWIIRGNSLGSASSIPFSDQVMSALKNLPALFPYLGKMFFPFRLSVFPILADMKPSFFLGIIALIIMIVLIFVTKSRQWPLYIFGLTWLLAFLGPALINLTHQVPNFSEHRGYLSLAGLIIFLLGCDPFKKFDYTKWQVTAGFVAIAILYGTLGVIHTGHFKNNFAFWQNAVDTSPSHAFNYNNLGAMYFLAGDYENAEPWFRKALTINPLEPMANSNAGLICMNTKRPAEAEKFYLEEIRINPGYEHVYYNLGLLYYGYSRPHDAIPLWEKLLKTDPGYGDAYKALLQVYTDLKMKDDFDRIYILAKKYGVKLN